MVPQLYILLLEVLVILFSFAPLQAMQLVKFGFCYKKIASVMWQHSL